MYLQIVQFKILCTQLRFYVFGRNVIAHQGCLLFDQKFSNNLEYYNLNGCILFECFKQRFFLFLYIYIYIFIFFKFSASLLQSSVSHDPSEIQ